MTKVFSGVFGQSDGVLLPILQLWYRYCYWSSDSAKFI